jgi:tetratricopeptide (TPR) repeat protein
MLRTMLFNLRISQVLSTALLLLGAGCSSATLAINSNPPKADVYATSVGNEKPRLVGQTPISMKAAELRSQYGGAGPFILELRKPGFQNVRTIVTDLGAADVSMVIELPAEISFEALESLNDAIDLMFEGQRLARAGRLDDAIQQLKQVQAKRPQLAAAYELEGGIYYVQKKYKEALDAYTIATRINPKNPSSVRMRDLLEEQLGKRTPAGRGP